MRAAPGPARWHPRGPRRARSRLGRRKAEAPPARRRRPGSATRPTQDNGPAGAADLRGPPADPGTAGTGPGHRPLRAAGTDGANPRGAGLEDLSVGMVRIYDLATKFRLTTKEVLERLQ